MSDNTGESQSVPPQTGVQAAMNHMSEKKIDTFLWLTRLGTITFTVLSMFPFLGVNPYTSYYRALLCNAATSALRLHQRMPRVQFSQAFGAMLIMEDSCHYLLYSLMFYISYPVMLSLLPIFLFAVLHSAHFSQTILNKLGSTNTFANSMLRSVIENYQQKMLSLVASTEVFMFFFIVLSIFSGKVSVFIPFAYFRFLTFRYASRRNPYTRLVFHKMRVVLEMFANTPGRNVAIRNLCHKIINFTSYLAPPTAPTQQ